MFQLLVEVSSVISNNTSPVDKKYWTTAKKIEVETLDLKCHSVPAVCTIKFGQKRLIWLANSCTYTRKFRDVIKVHTTMREVSFITIRGVLILEMYVDKKHMVTPLAALKIFCSPLEENRKLVVPSPFLPQPGPQNKVFPTIAVF